MSVSAIIVTRGDVGVDPILASLPDEWEKIVWDNGEASGEGKGGHVRILEGDPPLWRYENFHTAPDLKVYGRFAAIEYAKGELIYVQDDDVLHTTEGIKQIVGEWLEWNSETGGSDHIVCNMPANFRHAFYQEHSLVGFGSAFHRDLPFAAFERFEEGCSALGITTFLQGERKKQHVVSGPGSPLPPAEPGMVRMDPATVWSPSFDNAVFLEEFWRTCDIVFTGLTPNRILIDVDYKDMPWASAENRMWKQSYHREERGKILDLVLKVRDAN